MEALFDAVVDLAPDEAERYLAAACADAPALRMQVEKLLAHDRAAAANDFSPVPELLFAALDEARDGARRQREAPRPRRVGRFQVLDPIGSGSMGVVYAAYDETLDRRVALKLLHGDAISSSWLRREGQAIGRISHPNVVTVYEVGEHEGSVYLAMELVEGPTLRAWLAEERRSFTEVLRMFLQVGEGLAAVHAAGLMHRDFKPDNVLIGPDGRPRIADFGIAGVAEDDGAGAPSTPRRRQILEATLAGPGRLAGTPAYMAPEILAGERATPASDQWSFCAALYRAAYGTPPFPHGDGDVAAFSRRVIDGTPAPPPRRADVPAWLAPILLRGLARNPAARFPSQAALLAAIEGHLPRDPDLDPSVVRRDVQILRSAVLIAAVATVITVAIFFRPLGVRGLASISAFLVSVELTVIALRWRSITRNTFGRRSAGILVFGTISILLHRMLALEMGTIFEQVVVVDLLLMALIYAFVAVTVQRWVAVPAIIALAAAAAGAHFPHITRPVYLLGSVGTFLLVTLDAFRRR